jgi:hypothetical protein
MCITTLIKSQQDCILTAGQQLIIILEVISALDLMSSASEASV